MNFSDLQGIVGLQFMPVTQNKLPVVKGWQKLFTKHNLENTEAVGLVCGKLSGNLEVIDIDLKYDITGQLFDFYKRLVNQANPDLLRKLVVQKTQSGGYHFIYRCQKIEGNLKLARRYATDEEKKINKDEKIKVLLETRGEGGYIMCYPSKNYELIFGDWYSITEISEDERETLLNIARQFNEVVEDYRPQRNTDKKGIKGLSPFEDYNERGDVVGLLENHGWKIVAEKGGKTIFIRPGQTTSQSSGNYDHNKKWFSVFTTSSEFEPEKAYQPYAVFAVLECSKDFGEASRKLYDLDFGDRHERQREVNSKTPSRISLIDDDLSFIAKPEDYEEYLQQVKDGTLPVGLTTGFPSLDKHFLFKHGNLVMTNGHDNAGKSVITWYFGLLSALYHNWKWIIYSTENSLGSFMRMMIQFYWGKPIRGIGAMNEVEYKVAKEFIESHFTLIKSEDELFNYKDIINMCKKVLVKKYHDSILIDPYNTLKIELTAASKLNTHEYHYEALAELRLFIRKHKCGMTMNNHAVTAALRQKDGEKKFPVAPHKADTEGGGKFSNRADEFVTIHRLVGHPKDWMYTELHVRKVKETETGGRPTPIDEPVRIKMIRNGCGFQEQDLMNDNGVDPVKAWHNMGKPVNEMKFDKPYNPPNSYLPYKDDSDDENEMPF